MLRWRDVCEDSQLKEFAMPSFDVVSKVDWQEIDNAVNQALKEVTQRYDFKGSETKIEMIDESFVINSADDYKVEACIEVLEGKLAKRGVPLGSLKKEKVEPANGGRSRIKIGVRSGLEPDIAKKIVKDLKGLKLKVQAAIQSDSIRVTGKKRDDLQDCIAVLKEGDWGQPLQYENFRD
ncbi:MAG: hypothetical protein ACI8TX_003205 [Hyphomicrobiaceae bacterium]